MDEVYASEVIAHLEPLLRPRRVQRMKAVLEGRSDHVAFVFEAMVDPHNLSAVLRSLDAFSFQDVYMVRPTERVGLARGVTQGTERWLSLHVLDSAEACFRRLREAGYRVLASRPGAGEASTPLRELDFGGRLALVFGNEHAGVSEEVVARADGTFHIGMLGFVDSLNLSVAAAVSAFHARQQLRRLAAEAGDPERYRLPPARRRAVYETWLRGSVRRAEEILEQARRREA